MRIHRIQIHPAERAVRKNPHSFCQTNIILPQSYFTTKCPTHFADNTKTKKKSVIRYYYKNWTTHNSNQTADLAPAFSSPPN